ncbi:MAG: ATP-binding protein [Candidatus Sumerlaeota bacterium]|nr:ATP-binding protein [Candidatus Sumerlaeota bacterium]
MEAQTAGAKEDHATSDPARVVDALYRVNNFLSQVTDLHALLEAIMNESKAVVDADASSCLLYDEKADELYFEVALGEKGEGVKEIRLPMGAGIGGQCALERRTLVIQDCSKDPRHFKKADEKSQYSTRNLLATPMIRVNKLIGVLEVLNKHDDKDFTDDDIHIIEFFAGQAAIAIENALLIQSAVRAERLAAVGQAVAGISHYAKNILMGIKGSASLIDHALKINDMHILEQAWPILKRNNDKISNLVQDMLTYSKEREPELAPGNLNEVVKEAMDLYRETAAKQNVAIACQVDEEMPITAFDVKNISDAVTNLVGNAVDATAGRPNATVTGRTIYDASAKLIQAIVEDNGCGMPVNIQKKIFDPFFSTKGSKGTGLGLAITRKIVTEHKGTIDLKSTQDVGTTFTITLPARPPEEAE